MSLRKDFHTAVFHSISQFVAVLNRLAADPQIKAALDHAPQALKNGRTLTQIAMDDAMDMFVTVMADLPDANIPREFYVQMLRARDGAAVTQLAAESRLTRALAEKRKNPATAPAGMPDFINILIEEAPVTHLQMLVQNWAAIIQNVSQLTLNDEALKTKKAGVSIVQGVMNQFQKIMMSKMNNDAALDFLAGRKPGMPGGPMNDNRAQQQDEEGVKVHKVESLKPIDQELERLIGLEGPKKQVKKIMARVQHAQARKEAGVAPKEEKERFEHYVFDGEPGTGKTTFARLIGKIYHDAGLLKKGHVVEADRSSLVAGFVGQTALKTQKVINQALDGVLFIDEAYALHGQGNDFGKEAMTTLLKAMEMNKDRLIVVIAGYPEEIEGLVQSNPGLTRRFKHFMHFPSFSQDELMAIFDLNMTQQGLKITPTAQAKIGPLLTEMKQSKGKHFGNAGEVEKLVEELQDELAHVLEKEGVLANVKDKIKTSQPIGQDIKDKLITVTDEVVDGAIPKLRDKNKAISMTRPPVGFDVKPKAPPAPPPPAA